MSLTSTCKARITCTNVIITLGLFLTLCSLATSQGSSPSRAFLFAVAPKVAWNDDYSNKSSATFAAVASILTQQITCCVFNETIHVERVTLHSITKHPIGPGLYFTVQVEMNSTDEAAIREEFHRNTRNVTLGNIAISSPSLQILITNRPPTTGPTNQPASTSPEESVASSDVQILPTKSLTDGTASPMILPSPDQSAIMASQSMPSASSAVSEMLPSSSAMPPGQTDSVHAPSMRSSDQPSSQQIKPSDTIASVDSQRNSIEGPASLMTTLPSDMNTFSEHVSVQPSSTMPSQTLVTGSMDTPSSKTPMSQFMSDSMSTKMYNSYSLNTHLISESAYHSQKDYSSSYMSEMASSKRETILGQPSGMYSSVESSKSKSAMSSMYVSTESYQYSNIISSIDKSKDMSHMQTDMVSPTYTSAFHSGSSYQDSLMSKSSQMPTGQSKDMSQGQTNIESSASAGYSGSLLSAYVSDISGLKSGMSISTQMPYNSAIYTPSGVSYMTNSVSIKASTPLSTQVIATMGSSQYSGSGKPQMTHSEYSMDSMQPSADMSVHISNSGTYMSPHETASVSSGSGMHSPSASPMHSSTASPPVLPSGMSVSTHSISSGLYSPSMPMSHTPSMSGPYQSGSISTISSETQAILPSVTPSVQPSQSMSGSKYSQESIMPTSFYGSKSSLLSMSDSKQMSSQVSVRLSAVPTFTVTTSPVAQTDVITIDQSLMSKSPTPIVSIYASQSSPVVSQTMSPIFVESIYSLGTSMKTQIVDVSAKVSSMSESASKSKLTSMLTAVYPSETMVSESSKSMMVSYSPPLSMSQYSSAVSPFYSPVMSPSSGSSSAVSPTLTMSSSISSSMSQMVPSAAVSLSASSPSSSWQPTVQSPSVSKSASMPLSASSPSSIVPSISESRTTSASYSVNIIPSHTASASPSVSIVPSLTASASSSVSIVPSLTASASSSVSIVPSLSTSQTASASSAPSIVQPSGSATSQSHTMTSSQSGTLSFTPTVLPSITAVSSTPVPSAHVSSASASASTASASPSPSSATVEPSTRSSSTTPSATPSSPITISSTSVMIVSTPVAPSLSSVILPTMTQTVTSSAVMPTPRPIIQMNGEFKITDRTFTEALSDKTSPEYKTLQTDLVPRLDELFGESSVRNDYVRITDMTFSSGSIVVEYTAEFRQSEQVTPENVTLAFKNGLTQNNTMGDYTIDRDSIKHSVVSGTTAEPPSTTKPEPYKPVLPNWGIAVIVCGCVLLIFLFMMICVLCSRRHTRQKYRMPEDPDDIGYRRSWADSQSHEYAYDNKLAISDSTENGKDQPVRYDMADTLPRDQGRNGQVPGESGFTNSAIVYYEDNIMTLYNEEQQAWETKL